MLDGTNSCCESEKAAPCRKIIVLNIYPCIPWARGTPVSVECVNTLTRPDATTGATPTALLLPAHR